MWMKLYKNLFPPIASCRRRNLQPSSALIGLGKNNEMLWWPLKSSLLIGKWTRHFCLVVPDQIAILDSLERIAEQFTFNYFSFLWNLCKSLYFYASYASLSSNIFFLSDFAID